MIKSYSFILMVDLDSYFKNFKDVDNFNVETFFKDGVWSNLGALSHVTYNSENEDNIFKMYNANDENEKVKNSTTTDENLNDTMIQDLIDINDDYLKSNRNEETIRRHEEAQEKIIKNLKEKVFKTANYEKEYYERNYLLYEKLISNQSGIRYKNNKLYNCSNYDLERINLLNSNFSIDEFFPGLKPSSSWPFYLDDLLRKISEVEFGIFFMIPFDLNKTFYNESMEFCLRYSNIVKQYIIEIITKIHDLINNYDSKNIKLDSLKNCIEEYNINRNYLIKGIQATISILLFSGNFEETFKSLSTFKDKIRI
jgi:hypothetical protein